jgi:hypothetical protein
MVQCERTVVFHVQTVTLIWMKIIVVTVRMSQKVPQQICSDNNLACNKKTTSNHVFIEKRDYVLMRVVTQLQVLMIPRHFCARNHSSCWVNKLVQSFLRSV